MKITAIFEDNVIAIDGVVRTVTWSATLPAHWRAIQWLDNAGEIEFAASPTAPQHNEFSTDAGIPKLLNTLWANGSGGAQPTGPAPDDVVAMARAQVLDAFIVQAAQSPTAPQLLKDAAAKITTPDITLDIGTATVTDTPAPIPVVKV